MMLFSETEVERLLPIAEAITAVEFSMLALGAGEATNLPRRRLFTPQQAGLHAMEASLNYGGRWYMGFKVYSTGTAGAHFVVGLYDGLDGRPLAFFEANRLGQRRTGAASGLATRLLARPESTCLAVLGTGWQAESQVEAVCAVRPIRHLRVYSRNPAAREEFARAMEKKLGLAALAVSDARAAVRDADIVITATTSGQPVLPDDVVVPGMHINAVGANHLKRRELEPGTVRRCDRLVVDDKEQARLEAGELAVEPDLWERVEALPAVVSAPPVLRDPRHITLFKSTGLAIWDVACAAHIYNKVLRGR